jgi:hypothetical protein
MNIEDFAIYLIRLFAVISFVLSPITIPLWLIWENREKIKDYYIDIFECIRKH